MTDFAPSLADLMTSAHEASMEDVHVAGWARVISFDPARETVDVKPLYAKTRLDEDGNRIQEDLPLIQNVKVVFPRAGVFGITFPISQGDTVLLIFCDRNIGQWQETGEEGDPGDTRTHELSGAVAIPGIYPSFSASGHGNTESLVVHSPKIRLGSLGASEAMVLGDSLRSWLSSHTHGTGTGPTTSPIQAATLGQTLSNRHKIDE